MTDAIERATTLIRSQFAEPLTLNDIAASAYMSRFHFSRVFRQETGISPGRFLAAIRIHEAKRLLLTSQTSIADISCLVGYTSLGTFTTRFTECVGVSPGQFRRLAEHDVLGPVKAATPAATRPVGSLAGTVVVDGASGLRPVFLGVFDRRIPQGKPKACLKLPAAGEWFMEHVPVGEWYVLAVTTGSALTTYPHPSAIEQPMLVGGAGPLMIRDGALSSTAIRLRPPCPTDPPVLLALPSLLRNREPELMAKRAVG